MNCAQGCCLLRRYGVADVLSTVFADSYGRWGWLDLWRTADEGHFTELETEHVTVAAPIIAAGLRRSRAARMRRGAQSRRDNPGHADDLPPDAPKHPPEPERRHAQRRIAPDVRPAPTNGTNAGRRAGNNRPERLGR
jgi:hypothetical protein